MDPARTKALNWPIRIALVSYFEPMSLRFLDPGPSTIHGTVQEQRDTTSFGCCSEFRQNYLSEGAKKNNELKFKTEFRVSTALLNQRSCRGKMEHCW